MSVETVKVMDFVSGTSTNAEGFALYTKIISVLDEGSVVKLSLADATPFSSSFINSSLGAIVEEYGFNEFRNRIKLVNFKPSQAEMIKKQVLAIAANH